MSDTTLSDRIKANLERQQNLLTKLANREQSLHVFTSSGLNPDVKSPRKSAVSTPVERNVKEGPDSEGALRMENLRASRVVEPAISPVVAGRSHAMSTQPMESSQLRQSLYDAKEDQEQRQIMDRSLRSQLGASEDDRRRAAIKNMDLENQVKALLADAERREAIRTELEKELVTTTQAAKDMEEKTRQALQKNDLDTRKLQETVQDLQQENAALREDSEQLRRGLSGREREVRMLQQEMNSLAEMSRSTAGQFETKSSQVTDLQRQVSQLKAELQTVGAEAALVPALRDQVRRMEGGEARGAELEADVREIGTRYEQLAVVNQKNVDELRNSQNIVQELELHIAELQRRTHDFGVLESEISERRRQMDFASKELERVRCQLANAQSDIQDMKKDQAVNRSTTNESAANLGNKLSILSSAIEDVIAGTADPLAEGSRAQYLKAEEEKDEDEVESENVASGLEGLLSTIGGLSGKVSDALMEIGQLRRAQELLQQEIDSRNALVQARELDRQDTHRELLETKTRLAEVQMQSKHSSEDVTKLEEELRRTTRMLENSEKDIEEMRVFVYGLAKTIYEQPGLYDDEDPVPYTELTDNAPWATLRDVISEQVNRAVQQRVTLRHNLKSSQDLLKDSREIEEELRQKLEENLKKAEKERDETARKYRQEITEIRSQSRRAMDVTVTDAQQRLTELENELNTVRRESWDTSLANRKLSLQMSDVQEDLNATRTRLSHLLNMSRVVIVYLRNVRRTNRTLLMQKAYLCREVANLERLQGDIRDLVHAMSGEFHVKGGLHGEKRDYLSLFRVAAITVVAANRLKTFARVEKGTQERDTNTAVAAAMSPPSRNTYEELTEEILAFDEAAIPVVSEQDLLFSAREATLARVLSQLDPDAGAEEMLAQRTHWQRGLLNLLAKGAAQIARTEQTPGQVGLARIRKSTIAVAKRLRETERERNGLQKQNVELTETISRLQHQVEDMEDTNGKSNELVKFLETRTRDLEDQILAAIPAEKHDALEADLNAMRVKVEGLMQDKEDLRHELDAQLGAVGELRVTLQKADNAAENANTNVSELNAKIKDLQEQLDMSTEYMQRKAREMANTEDSMRATEVELDDSKASLQRTVAEAQELRTRLNSVYGDYEDAKRTIQKLEVDNLQLQRSVKDNQMLIQRQGADLKRRERDLESSQGVVAALTDSHTRQSEQMLDLSEDLTATKLDLTREKSALRQQREDTARSRLQVLSASRLGSTLSPTTPEETSSPSFGSRVYERNDLQNAVSALNNSMDSNKVASPLARTARSTGSRLGQSFARTLQQEM